MGRVTGRLVALKGASSWPSTRGCKACLVTTSLAAGSIGREKDIDINPRTAHTFSRIPRVACIAFACGSNICKHGQRCKTNHEHLPTNQADIVGATATEATEEIGDKIDIIVLIDLRILSRCSKLSVACAWPCGKVAMSSTEWQHCCMASESSESVNVKR